MEQLLDKKVVDLLEYRIQQEEFSARLYKQISLWLENKGYKHLSILYDNYAGEEQNHAKWACNYLLNYGITPKLQTIPSPFMEFETCMEVLETTLEHERTILKQCEELYQKASDAKKPSLQALALKYCEEQDDEIGKALDIIDHAKLTTDMLVLDHYVERYIK